MNTRSRDWNRKPLLAAAALGAALLSCTPINPTVGLDWDGQTYRLLLGATLVVQLPADAETTTCAWRIAEVNQVFLRRIDNADTLAPGIRSQLANGDWVDTFRFQGVERGTTGLQIEYRCDLIPTGETFDLTVHVIGSGI